jgi:hypothetical protein
VLELPAGQQTTFSGFNWNDPGFHVRGEMEDGRSIPHAEVLKEPTWKTIEIVIHDGAAAISGR